VDNCHCGYITKLGKNPTPEEPWHQY
jgi:hypothetical protein